jgi:hypothetical protein
MNPAVIIMVSAVVVAVFAVPFLASRVVRDRGDGWVEVFFPGRQPRWPDGIQEQDDLPWRWRGTEPRVDPPVPRRAPRATNPDASVRPVGVERIHPRTRTH